MAPDGTRAKGGRPPGFQFDGEILREHREARGLKPAAAHKLALPAKTIDDDSRARNWCRWEATGRIEDRATAELIAQAVGTNLAVLQGGPAPDRVAEIAQRLQQQAASGNEEAKAALTTSSSEEDSLKVARSLATRIELAQLTRQSTLMNDFARVTGWSLKDLEQPANLHGYWLVASENAQGLGSTQILLGADAAIWHAYEEIIGWLGVRDGKYASATSPDARLVFREEAPWFRVRLEHPVRPWSNRTLSLVRCEAAETGLRWTNPGRYDRQQIQQLPSYFWEHANFIEGFSAGQFPEIRQLRLVIERHRPKRIKEALERGELLDPEVVAIVQGELPDLEDERLQMFRSEGASHPLVVNWIAQGLWPKLQEDLQGWPRECWKVRAGQGLILIELEVRPYLASQLGRLPRNETRYRIRLAALEDGGRLLPQPWRADGVADTIRLLERALGDLPSAPPGDQLFVGPPRPAGLPESDD